MKTHPVRVRFLLYLKLEDMRMSVYTKNKNESFFHNQAELRL